VDEGPGHTAAVQTRSDLTLVTDTHCHVDQFESPESVVRDCLREGINVVAVTNLPSHFEIAINHLSGVRHIYPALGMHPLAVAKHSAEVERFVKLAPRADFIGEIGLDFSHVGRDSRDMQERAFETILHALADRSRFITIHSRGAERETLAAISAAGLRKAVFHWYTGPLEVATKIISGGHYFSINPAMLNSRRFPDLIESLPRDRILVESDGPHVLVQGRPVHPRDVNTVVQYLERRWKLPRSAVEAQIVNNFRVIAQR